MISTFPEMYAAPTVDVCYVYYMKGNATVVNDCPVVDSCLKNYISVYPHKDADTQVDT